MSETRDKFIELVDQFQAVLDGESYLFSADEAITLFTGWLESEITEETEGSLAAISRRVTFLFDSGHLVTLGTSIPITVSHLSNRLTEEDLPPSLSKLNLKWNYKLSANGFGLEGTSSESAPEAAKVLAALEEEFGTPILLLPWEDYLSDLEDNDSDDEEFEGIYGDEELEIAFYKLLKLVLEFVGSVGIELTEIIRWPITICSPTHAMPHYSSYSKFDRFIEEMERDGKFRIVLEEHCAACFHGTNEQLIKENPELENAPVFITWGQHSENSYKADGEIYTGDQDYEEDWPMEYIKKLAKKHGLECDEFGSLS
jgi:hypothetical protein